MAIFQVFQQLKIKKIRVRINPYALKKYDGSSLSTSKTSKSVYIILSYIDTK